MKKLNLFIASLLVSIFFFSISVNAINLTQPISDTYKEGVYRINDKAKYYATATLSNKNKIASLLIIDSENRIRLYKNFDTSQVNDSLNIGYISSEDTIVVLGIGEIAIRFYSTSP
ncbi:hypothetical protein JCM1393_00310 [Clostridium carnis]